MGADFWNHFYNIGSGKEYRISNYEFEHLLLGTLGLAGPEKLFDPNWFILKNFHGQFYADGDKLEDGKALVGAGTAVYQVGKRKFARVTVK